jgi:ribosomal protein L40E
MAMKPKDRYQFVADFANELKRVLAALPPPPQTPGEPHSAGPYATEPNLPERFEAIQAAREQQNQGSAQAQEPAVATQHCPRCHAQLAARAAFCQRCGLALGRTSTNPASSPSNAHPTTQNNPTDSTPHMAYKEQGQARYVTYPQPPSANPPMSRFTPGMPGLKTSGPQQAVMPPQKSTTAITQTPPGTNSIGTINRTPQAPGENQHVMLSSMNVKIVVAIAIAVILVLIIILLLATHGH